MRAFFSARSVVESPSVEERVDKLRKSHERFEDVFDGLKWLLARNGDILGQAISASGDKSFRVYKTPLPVIEELSEMRVVYKVTDETIELIDLDVI